MANPQDSRQHAVAGPEVGPDVAPARSVTPVSCTALAVSPAPLGSMCAFNSACEPEALSKPAGMPRKDYAGLRCHHGCKMP